MRGIMDKVGFMSVTIRTVVAHVTLLTTSVANTGFVISGSCTSLLFLSRLASELYVSRRGFLLLAADNFHGFDQAQSSHPKGAVKPPLVSTADLWAICS